MEEKNEKSHTDTRICPELQYDFLVLYHFRDYTVNTALIPKLDTVFVYINFLVVCF